MSDPSVYEPKERARLNAAAKRVLAHLQQHGSATNVQLSKKDIGGLRFGARLKELRDCGHDIRKAHVIDGLWAYNFYAPNE